MPQANRPTTTQIGEDFSRKYWEKWPDVYEKLVAKDRDRSYPLDCVEHTNTIHRALLCFDFIRAVLPKGAKILDIACGIGFNTIYLNVLGYEAEGFDISAKGIERAKALAGKVGQAPSIFTLADHNYLQNLPAGAYDAAMAMGLTRYMSADDVAKLYEDVHRALRPNGLFLVSNQNILFEAFAFNDGSQRFWADLIEDIFDVKSLLGDKTALDAIKDIMIVPQREFASRSVSKDLGVYTENPLTYAADVAKRGFRLEKILYPDINLLPAAIESRLDQKKVHTMKSQVCLNLAEDWRGALMDYEFLAFLRKE